MLSSYENMEAFLQQENVYIEMCKGEIIQELLNECGTLKTSKQLYSNIQNDTKKTK